MGGAVRTVLVIVGILLMVGGIGFLISGLPGVPIGLQMVALGAFLVVVLALEKSRYRSEAAERTNAVPGPGGGEPSGSVEPRFRATAEVFIDPTSGRRMRVLVDPTTGERRYVAEG